MATAGAAAAALVGTHGVLTATGAVAVGAVKTATAVGGLVAGGSQIVVDATAVCTGCRIFESSNAGLSYPDG